jgi:hypothetical protein
MPIEKREAEIGPRGSMKSTKLWLDTRSWCEQNPDRTAAIYTPQGTFEITFKPRRDAHFNAKGNLVVPGFEETN